MTEWFLDPIGWVGSRCYSNTWERREVCVCNVSRCHWQQGIFFRVGSFVFNVAATGSGGRFGKSSATTLLTDVVLAVGLHLSTAEIS